MGWIIKLRMRVAACLLFLPQLGGAEILGPLAHIHVDLPVLSGLAVHVVQDPLVAVPKQQMHR